MDRASTRGPADAAAERLGELPKTGRPGWVRHPFPVASSDAYGGRVTRDAAESADVREVPLDRLEGVQRHVSERKVRDYLERDGKAPEGARDQNGYPRDLPIVVETGGRLLIHDGHHRMTAQALLGHESAEARVVPIEPHPLTRWSRARDRSPGS